MSPALQLIISLSLLPITTYRSKGKWDPLDGADSERIELDKDDPLYDDMAEEGKYVLTSADASDVASHINKGDDLNPEYRSRLMAMVIKKDDRKDSFAPTPPLEAKKILFALAVTGGYGFEDGKRKEGKNHER